ncbi:MAG: amidohydrolase family protein, partial [Myxococcota bacterium]|nr:amidohydrolase family protein [Myxococcota bacterium]
MYDLKIRGGLIYDGSGAEPVHGDLALRDGEIVAVGSCPDQATREMNAEGLAVTPGFIDLHTHYDGQASWDEELAPSSVHGVTTALMGNCGVGFAPARAKDREALIHLMEGVEDIPGSALSEGIEWSWESFPEFLETLDRRAHTIDLAAQVPH